MMTHERLRVVVDPAWRKVNRESYATAWRRLVTEATGCAFVGVDLEWTSRVVPVPDEEKSEEEGTNKDNRRLFGSAEGEEEERPAVKKASHFVGPVAVVQLSTFSVTFVIKLCDVVSMTGGGSYDAPRVEDADIPVLEAVQSNLRTFLADSRIIKVGVGILGDQAKLQGDYATFRLAPCVDLVVLTRRLLLSSCTDVGQLRSLKDLAARFAGRTLEKDTLVTRSDWGGSLGPLSPVQVEYAAADAEASFDVCVGVLVESRLVDSGEVLQAACDTQNEALSEVASALHAAIGLKPSSKQKCRGERPTGGYDASGWCKGRVKPYYNNIFVYDTKMNLLFTVDKSKAEWYVYKKGIAKVTEWREVADDESTTTGTSNNNKTEEARKEIAAIQLSFDPDFSKYNNAHIGRNLDYFRIPKENQCVVCGRASELVRFAVVPVAYRRYFPSVYMSHNSYDLLLLCTMCFAGARMLYDGERQRIAADFGAPLTHFTPEEIRRCRAQLQQEASASYESGNDHSNGSLKQIITHETGVCLSFAQKARAFEMFLEIEEHRSLLLVIFKYAKALHAAHMEASVKQEAPGCAGPKGTRVEGGGTTQKKNGGRMRTKSVHIPVARVEELSKYIRLHAPKYPFAKCASDQAALFSTDAASPASIRCILEEGVSPRAVLRRFWFQKHPELFQLFSCTTRKGESHRADDVLSRSCDNDGEGEDALSVDTHGFIVVQALLQKYDGHAHKCRDHAVGEFIYRWRTVFLQGMRPKHLPESWRADDGILL